MPHMILVATLIMNTTDYLTYNNNIIRKISFFWFFINKKKFNMHVKMHMSIQFH